MPKFKIKHLTRYTYIGPVSDSANQIILYPFDDEYQVVHKHELTISNSSRVSVFKDYYGNEVGNFTYNFPHSSMEIESCVEVSTSHRPLPASSLFSQAQWEELTRLKSNIEFIDFLGTEDFDAQNEVRDVIANDSKGDQTPYDFVLKYCKYVYETFSYIPGVTTVESTLDEVWRLKAGVCQDFAHILLVMLRMAKIPARYVSGYICPNKNGMRGEGATHAWVEAYLPNYGWLGLDPTNNCIANETHVRLAVGRNFSDCSPVKGVYKGAPEHALDVVVSVAYQDENTQIASIEDVLQDKPIVLPEAKKIIPQRNSYREYSDMLQMQLQQQQ